MLKKYRNNLINHTKNVLPATQLPEKNLKTRKLVKRNSLQKSTYWVKKYIFDVNTKKTAIK
jgi:hypothetical protein